MQLPIYFFGDNHFQLSSSEKEDKKIEKFSQFLNSITNNSNQGTLFIMGDLFDYYFEYKNRTPEYHQKIFAMLADIKNTGPRAGGSITAALFLREFVKKDIAWAHIDIAGTCWSDKGFGVNPAGATGYGVQTLGNWACNQNN